MNYQETIDYLFSKLPMFSRIGAAAYKKDLTNIILLSDKLGNPHNQFKSIHVAGTNGKGSVSHMLAAILQTAGYRTGLYTSPHLRDFRERIRVNGEMVSKEFITSFTEKIKPLMEEMEPSFFEITVAMAFCYFVEKKVDIAIIEVGLGGRLDSTNIIHPDISVITNIGRDHLNILGDSLQKIAFEKAGIIKNGVPVVVGESSPETKQVFETVASQKNAQLFFASELKSAVEWNWEKHELVVMVGTEHKTDRQQYNLDLPGLYQAKNLITALEVVSQLQQRGWVISEKAIKKGLRKVKKLTGFHGRWETIHEFPAIVLDVAHNEDGIRSIVKQIEVTDHKELHIILGMVKDKEIDSVLYLLPCRATYYFTEAHIPRALNKEILQQKASFFGLEGKTYFDVNVAIKDAIQKADKTDLVVVCGSVFLIGEVNTTVNTNQ